MLKVGDRLPEFSEPNQDGKTIHSKDYKGKKLIVYFYPKAMTPGCTAEACNLRDNYKQLMNSGYQLLGVSADEENKQKKFATTYDLPFDLLADTDRKVIEAFGVWQLKKFMGKEYMGIARTTFIFDENSVCTNIIDKVKTDDHTAQILGL